MPNGEHSTLIGALSSPSGQQKQGENSSNKTEEIYRNGIKSTILRAGMTIKETVGISAKEYGRSSLSNLLDKLKRGTLRYGEAVELADVLGYDLVWKKRGG